MIQYFTDHLCFQSFLAGSGSRLFKYLQTIQALLGSPIMAVFLIGILWPRANGWGGLGGVSLSILDSSLGSKLFFLEVQ